MNDLGLETNVDDALNCPLCNYDLRGLPQNRCPECGHAFEPEQLRRAKLERQDWLFEHAKRRSIAFAKTAAASLVPPLLWKRLSPASEVKPGRLQLWAAAWAILIVVPAITAFVASAVLAYQEEGPSPMRSSQNALGEVWTEYRLSSSTMVLIVATIWPALTVPILQLFGATLHRAGIRAGHLWRCTLYAIPLMVIPCTIVACVSCFTFINGMNRYNMLPWQEDLMRALPTLVSGLQETVDLSPTALILLVWVSVASTVHLTCAHVQYLRLPHALAQSLLAQIVTWLLLAIAIIFGYARI